MLLIVQGHVTFIYKRIEEFAPEGIKGMIQIKLIYKILLTIDATILFLFLYLVKNKIWIPYCGKISVVIYLGIILIFTFICLQSKVVLKKGSIEGNIIDISLANDSYMANYLGYFFVALSLSKDWVILGVVYAIVFVFTYKSQSLFYNPLFLLLDIIFIIFMIRRNEGILLQVKRKIYVVVKFIL